MSLLVEFRHALRVLRRAPVSTAAIIVSLAIGIGGTTAVFSVLDGVVLRPLDYPEPDRLVRVYETVRGTGEGDAAPANFLDWRRDCRTLEGLTAIFEAGMPLAAGDEPEQVRVQSVSGTFFTLLGARALHGRTFLPTDDEASRGQRLAVLGHALWQRRFGADPAVVGRAVQLGGTAATIIGVMPTSFRFEPAADLWLVGQGGIPEGAPVPGDQSQIRDAHYLAVVARLRGGATIALAQAEMDTLAARLAREYPTSNVDMGVGLVPLRESWVRGTAPMLFLLLGAVLVTLLIACANVANLLLVRATARARELALRASLGAPRRALVRQLLVESLVLAAAGGLLGTLLAAWGVEGLLALAPVDLPRAAEVGLDLRVLAMTLGVSMAAGLLVGAWPAWRASRPDLTAALQGGRASAAPEQRRAQHALVGAELAIAQVLLVCGGLLLAGFARVSAVDPGFDPAGVITAELSLPARPYSDPDRRARFIEALLDRVRVLPGVTAAASASRVPMSPGINRGVRIDGQPDPTHLADHTTDFYTIGGDYFRTLGARLVRGRGFDRTDGGTSPTVAIVNEAFARKYFPGEDPIGRRIGFGNRSAPGYWRTVVGIAGDVRQRSLGEPAVPQVFIPFAQDREGWNFAGLVVRAAGDPLRLSEAVRRAVLEVDPAQPVARLRTLASGMAASVAAGRFALAITGLFAAMGLLLAAVGTFGVVSDAVRRRTREFGIRVALGARQDQVVRLVMGLYARLVATAVLVGLAGAWLLGGALRAWIVDAAPADPIAFAGAAALLTVSALAAAYLPARRALNLDASATLRAE